MKSNDFQLLLELTAKAAGSRFGIELVVPDTQIFQRKFYAFIREEQARGNTPPSLVCSIQSPTVVWLCPKEEKNG